jgi:AraC family transcriptional regulator
MAADPDTGIGGPRRRMDHHPRATMNIGAELSAPGVRAQLVHYGFTEPPESRMRLGDTIRVELCLVPRHRSARASFPEYWRPSRFERIGEVFVVPPMIDMRVRSDEDRPLTSVLCHLDLPPVLALFDRVPDFDERFLVLTLDIRDVNVRHLLLRLADEIRHPGFASRILVEAIATQLGVELLRSGAALPERSDCGGLAPWQLRRIEERLMEVREPPTLRDLATLCGTSVRQLTRSFRAVRGCSVGRYVSERQLVHARRLLGAGGSIAEIAATLGFSSTSNFCFAFRRASGMTPGQYRQALSHWSSAA